MLRNEGWARNILEIIIAEDKFGLGVARDKIRSAFKDLLIATKQSVSPLHDNIVDYHLHLLETAGYLKRTPSSESKAYDKFEMTWRGHSYSEA